MSLQVLRQSVWIRITVVSVVLVGLAAVFALAFAPAPAASIAPASFQLVQDDVVVAPEALERLSWGAVLAGTALALIIQVALNLLGVGIGATTLDPHHSPRHPYRQSDAAEDAKSGLTMAAVWVGVSTIIALFVGGLVAARFAGLPNALDGVLHGLITWAVVMLISFFLLSTTLGRLISGITNLLGEGMHIAGQAANTVLHGAANVAGGAAHLAGSAARGTANAVGHAAQSAAHTAQDKAADAARSAEHEMDTNPDVQRATSQLQQTIQQIQSEMQQMVQQVVSGDGGQQPQNEAVAEARQAVQEARRHPENAPQILSQALSRLFQQGQAAVNQTDREQAVRTITEHTALNEQQARQLVQKWEDNYGRAQSQLNQARQAAGNGMNRVREEADRVRHEVEHRVEDARDQVEHQVDRARHEAERVAIEAADATRKVVAGLALAAFAAMLLGGIAAAIGGWLGVPAEPIIEAEIETEAFFRSFM